MPISLKCMIGSWLHKGKITQEEHDAIMKKLEGHDKQLKAELFDKLKQKQRTIIDDDGVMYKVVFLKDIEGRII